ncbi:hypothetical protein [Sphingobacterium mizutaii]|uniref:hypothetical protein n=1 Tax=Sphingobacterium mizutaii TaxID=1010 RepID=UPI00289DAFC5|nr:hypothetical protein [Sphingobacterium mizutaii]
MATVKFSDEMPKPTSIKGTDRFLISDGVTGEAKAPDFNQAKEYLNITGIEMEPLVGGTTSGTALVVPNGPAGEQRTAEVSSGKWYDFGSGPVQASADRRWKSYWNGTSWVLKDMGELPSVDKAATVIEGGTDVPTQDAVFKFVDPKYVNKVIDHSQYLITGVGYDGTGAEVTTSSAAIIKNVPVSESDIAISLLNTYNDSLMKYFFKNSSGAIVGGVKSNASENIVALIPAGAVSFCASAWRNNNGLKPNFSLIRGDYQNNKVNSILGASIVAKTLDSGNYVPTPTTVNNAAPKGYVDNNFVANIDIGTSQVPTSNYLDLTYLVVDKYINSDGSIGNGGGNHILQNHPIGDLVGGKMTIGRMEANSLKKLVFRNELGDITGPVRSLTTLPLTVDVPAGTTTFDMSLKRSSESATTYAQGTINKGAEQLPYEPHLKTLATSIKGYEIYSPSGGGGGGNSNQETNTYSDVEFNSVKTGLLEMTSWAIDLPTGAGTPPPEVLVGHAWIDTTNGTVKRRMS